MIGANALSLRFVRLLFVVCGLLVPALVACSDDEPPTSASCRSGQLLHEGQCLAGERYEATIHPEGGEQRLGDRLVLWAPADAVAEPTSIAVTYYPVPAPGSQDARRYLSAAVTFEPPGTAFLKPVTFAVPTAQELPPGTPLGVVPVDAPEKGVNLDAPLGDPSLEHDSGTDPRLAVVAATGHHAIFQQVHFSTAAVIADVDLTNMPAKLTRVLSVAPWAGRQGPGGAYGGGGGGTETTVWLPNLTDDLFDLGSRAPAWGDCAGLARMQGLDSGECRKQLYKHVLAEALLQVDATDSTIYEELFANMSEAVGGFVDGVDLAGDALKIALFNPEIARALREHSLGWSKFATFRSVRGRFIPMITTIVDSVERIGTTVAIGEDLLRLVAFQSAFTGLLDDRVEAFDRALLPGGGHIELSSAGVLSYVDTTHASLVKNDLTADRAFLEAYAEVRGELKRGMDCGDSSWQEGLCLKQRLELYLDNPGGESPPSLAKYVQPKFYVEKGLKWVLKDLLLGTSASSLGLLIALDFSIDTYTADVVDAVRDQMQRGLAANAIYRLQDPSISLIALATESPSLSTRDEYLEHIHAQTVTYMTYRFYRNSARAFSFVDRSLFSQAVHRLFFETKLCLGAATVPHPPFVVPVLFCPDEQAIQARDRLVEQLNAYAAALFDIYRKMAGEIALCASTACYGSCGDGICEPEEGTCAEDCLGCLVQPWMCEDWDPCTNDVCMPIEGEFACVSLPRSSEPNCQLDCAADPSTCDDGRACTVDACLDGACSNTYDGSLPGCACSADPALCDDGDACTADECTDDACTNEHDSTLPGCGCAADPSVCDDGDPCTVDGCAQDACVNIADATLPGCDEGGCVSKIVVGNQHTCALKYAGSLWCWGHNSSGELGDGSTTRRLSPVQVSALGDDVLDVAAGAFFTCALKSDGSLWCWGRNGSGELGTGDEVLSRSNPVQVSALGNDVVEVELGDNGLGGYSCARTQDGTLWCWGQNGNGSLGDGTRATKLSPVQVSTLGNEAVDVALGGGHSCARTQDGALWCWGDNDSGQLGDGTAIDRLSPVQVSAPVNSVAALGRAHTCARTQGGALWCWGHNEYGQLGDGTTVDRSSPVLVSADGVVDVAAGATQTCAIKQDGTVWCWGSNFGGSLGDGMTIDSSSPALVSALGSVAVISLRAGHSCAIKQDGTVWCWGSNDAGQLGNGTKADNYEPLEPVEVELCP